MYIFYRDVINGSASVQTVVYDEITLTEEQKSQGIHVEHLPEPENRPGKVATLKYSETDGLYYEYVDRPLTQDEQMEALKAENQALNTAVVELYEIVLGGI